MVKYFHHIASNISVDSVNTEIGQNPSLWNEFKSRKNGVGSPHSQMSDIWIRYNHKDNMGPTFNSEHDSVWYPAYYKLPSLKPIIFWLMNKVHGERLGGVLITKISPGCGIAPHIDRGWHVAYYDKYYVSLQSAFGANFICGEEYINPKVGDVWKFDNQIEHSVDNNSLIDRVTLIVCIRSDRGPAT